MMSSAAQDVNNYNHFNSKTIKNFSDFDDKFDWDDN